MSVDSGPRSTVTKCAFRIVTCSPATLLTKEESDTRQAQFSPGSVASTYAPSTDIAIREPQTPAGAFGNTMLGVLSPTGVKAMPAPVLRPLSTDPSAAVTKKSA